MYRQDEVANAAAELTTVLALAVRHRFRGANRTGMVELLAEFAELRNASDGWLSATAEPAESETAALVGKYRKVTALVADAIQRP
jgi:hypothetical protein